jgi:L-ascorbate metabolism protein UlaG (beta-lactamase superfamily)
MKDHVAILAVVLTMLVAQAVAQEKLGDGIMFTPIEHATMVMTIAKTVIYVDPVGDFGVFAKFPPPDIILITHIHQDHFSPALIASLKKDGTDIIGPTNVIEKLGDGKVLNNGDKITVKGVDIEAVPAYNLTKERLEYHPRGRDNGYVITWNDKWHGKRIYISGDTEDTKEMRGLKRIDYAFVCVNLPYTMSVEQAASAMLEMKPKVVIPYHYRTTDGLSNLGEFKRLVSEDKTIEVRLLKWYK